MNVHLEAFQQVTRQAQARVILDRYQELDSGNIVLLVGDFNTDISYTNSVIAMFLKFPTLRAVFHDQLGNKDYYTFPANDPVEKIGLYLLQSPQAYFAR